MVTEPEPDSQPETDTARPKNDDLLPERRISLSCGDQAVVVEGPDDLDEIAKLAAYFWLLTAPPSPSRLGFSAGGTLITERADTWAEQGGDQQDRSRQGTGRSGGIGSSPG